MSTADIGMRPGVGKLFLIVLISVILIPTSGFLLLAFVVGSIMPGTGKLTSRRLRAIVQIFEFAKQD
jgi:hypothetical protein